MGIFFSKKKDHPPKQPTTAVKPKQQELSDSDKASLELKRARDRLRRQQDAAELCIEQEKAMAKELVQKGQKSKAILVLKRKAMKEKLLERARGQMLNVETLIENIAEADNNLKVFEILKQGNTTLKDLQSQMSIDDINDILDDTAESLRVQEEISAALSQSLNTNEQAEIDAEVAAMMELMDQGMNPFEEDTNTTTTPVVEEKPIKTTKTTKTIEKIEENEPNYEDLLPDAPKHTGKKIKKQHEEQYQEEQHQEEQEEEEAMLA